MRRKNKDIRKKKKLISPAKLKKTMMGSISIFLVLIITPFLSTGLALVEYGRYQQVMALTEELYELVGISMLSDYDQYMHNRFGLLATSQDADLGDGADDMMSTNLSLLGNQVTVENLEVTGSIPLSNNEILERQILDYSELTGTFAFVMEDLQGDKLMGVLSKLQQFSNIMQTVENVANLTEDVKIAVEKLQAVKTSLDSVVTLVTTATEDGEKLAEDLAEFYEKINNAGITLPENAEPEEIEAAIAQFEPYVNDLKDIYETAKDFIDSLKAIKPALNTVKSSVDEFITAFNTAKSTAQGLTTTNGADSDGSVSAAAKGSAEGVIQDLTDLVNDTLSDVKTAIIEEVENAIDQIINSAIDAVGLGGITARYTEIVSGDYFKYPLESDMAKQDLEDLIKAITKTCAEKNGDALKQLFIDKLIPDFTDLTDLPDTVQGVLNDAETSLAEKIGESIAGFFSKLASLVNNIFDLAGVVDPNLNAFVNVATPESSEYETFLNAIGDFVSALNNFGGDQDDNWWEKIVKALTAVWDMLVAVKDMFVAIFDILGGKMKSLFELGMDMFSDPVGLYEQLVITSYMAHNLPNRVCAQEVQTINTSDGLATRVKLAGTGMTGYPYDDIARPYTIGEAMGSSGITYLKTICTNLQNGGGTDKMFKGAELEYIMAGTDSELANQGFVFLDLYFMRLVCCLPGVFMDGEVASMATAANVFAWVVYLVYILIEPLIDCIILVNDDGENEPCTVPIVKLWCWATPSHADDLVEKLADAATNTFSSEITNFVNGEDGKFSGNPGQQESGTFGFDPSELLEVDYVTHCVLLLYLFTEHETQVERFSHLLQMEASCHYEDKGKDFSMNKAYTAVTVSGDTTFNSFFDLGLAAGEGPLDISGRKELTVGY